MAEEERLHNTPTQTPSRLQPATRTDTIGRERTRPAPPPTTPAAETDADRPIGHADCAHGQRHAILRDGAGYRLEAR
jgi:hypothetical protein